MTRTVEPSQQLLNRLASQYYKWDSWIEGNCCIGEEPLTLSSETWGEICELSTRFNALLEKTIEMVKRDPRLMDFFKFSKLTRKMISSDPKPQDQATGWTGVSRFDFLPTEGGWVVAEFNTDVPGGYPEALGLNELLAERYPKLKDPNRVLIKRIVEHLRRVSGKFLPVVAFVFATGYSEDLQCASLLREKLRRHGIEVVLGNPRNLAIYGREATMFDRPIDVIYRYFPAEWYHELPRREVTAYLDAHRCGLVRAITPFSQLIIQSKKISAFWVRFASLFTSEEQALIRRHIPRTRLFCRDQTHMYKALQDQLALKRFSGRMGENVLVGRCYEPAEWDAIVDEISRYEAANWTVQDLVPVSLVRNTGALYYPCVGIYVIAGKPAGVFTRLSSSRVTAYNALNVPTFIEP